MRTLFLGLILGGAAWCQTATPPAVPTPLAYAVLLSPASPAFLGLATPPVFAPVLYVYITVQNAQAGVTYTLSVAGATKLNSFSLGAQTSLNSAWTVVTY